MLTKSEKQTLKQKIMDCVIDAESNTEEYHWSLVFEYFAQDKGLPNAPPWWPYKMRKLAQYLRNM